MRSRLGAGDRQGFLEFGEYDRAEPTLHTHGHGRQEDAVQLGEERKGGILVVVWYSPVSRWIVYDQQLR